MRIIFFIFLVLTLPTACARIPEPIGYQYTTQPKMQAAYHWVVLASDVANKINNQLILHDYARTPVYVRETCGDEDTPCTAQQTSPFTEAFRDLLITELVQFGVPVRNQPNDGSITVHYKVQLVHHNGPRLRTIQPGVLTSIATGIMVFRNASHELRTIAGAGLLDFMNASAVNSSSHEVIITTSMLAKEQYILRTSDIYYINDRDSGHYRHAGTHDAAEIPLVGPAGSPPAAHYSPAAPLNQGEPPTVIEEPTVIPDI